MSILTPPFEELAQRYERELYLTCYGILGHREDAADALQETMLRAWRGFRGFRGEAQWRTWFHRIAVNTCRDYRRTAWFRYIDSKAALESLPPRLTQTTEKDHDMMLTVCSLPDKFRQIILMYYYQGLTEQETSQVLGISLSTAHRRLKKAEDLLRAELKGGERHEG